MTIEITHYKMKEGTTVHTYYLHVSNEVRNLKAEDIPLPVRESMAILDAAGNGVTVEGVGTRQRLNLLVGHRYILDMEELP